MPISVNFPSDAPDNRRHARALDQVEQALQTLATLQLDNDVTISLRLRGEHISVHVVDLPMGESRLRSDQR